MSSSETKINIKEAADEVTLKLDAADLERTLRLSDEELQKAVKQANNAPSQTGKISVSGNTTSFFTIGKTSSFGAIFEKKRIIEDELADDVSETSIASDNISKEQDDKIPLHFVEDSFNIITKIGEGGQGIVSTAADHSLGRIVALKSLHHDPEGKNQSREHFIAEAKITAQLDYPGIVPIYSLNTDHDGGLHLAMKFINGETLADYLDRVREQYSKNGVDKFDEQHSMRKRIDIFLRICDAVAYAHNRNVMHCDLKPENVMLGKYNDSYIMDWGIARLINDPACTPENWERPTSISGTPRYLSPETIEGVYTDERIDVYALGMILFECVFLKTAYNGKDTKEVLARVRSGEIESFTHFFGCSVNKDLCAVIRKAVEHDREKRYQSVAELADDLRRYLANEETVAKPDNIFAKIVRFSQRHIKVLLIMILTVLLLAGGVISYSVYKQNQQANFMLKREVALSEAYSRALYISGLIELHMNHVSGTLKTLTAYVSFLLEQQNAPEFAEKNYFLYPAEQLKKVHASDIVFSEPCNKHISLERMSFNHKSGRFDAKMLVQVNRLQKLQGVLKQILLYGDIFREKSELQLLSEKDAEKYFFQHGSPILWFYCGLENGLYFSMPGYLDQSEDYDPRSRSWYIAGAKRTPFDDVVWSAPYKDAISKRLTLTASIPVFVRQKLQGVLAIDNMLQYISRFMKNHGNTDGFLLEKVIIDAEGRVLLSTREDYSVIMKNDDESVNGVYTADEFFGDKNIFPDICKKRNGIKTVKTSSGRNIVYLFSRINTHGWQYVEKIDMDMLIDSIEQQDKIKKLENDES